MCGFAAILRAAESHPEDRTSIKSMLRTLSHRGPDGQGTAELEGATLGHTRLSIVDIAGGAQPMADQSGRYVVVFNGEIYNFIELRRELEQSGAVFASRSDTEVLLKAYQVWGEAMLDRLNGQFAFLIWDTHTRQAFCARDRFGEKPFYFAHLQNNGLIAASEIKAILAANLLSPRISGMAVTLYLALLYVPPDRSIYNNIVCLAPAHAMRWTDTGVRIWRYWQPKLSGSPLRDPREIAEGVRHYFRAAIQRQMRSDVPVGAFLSGGLDSSSIVAGMYEFHPDPIETFSAYFAGDIDERPYAREVAKLYGTNHHEVEVLPPNEDELLRLVDIYDEPFADSSSVATLRVAQEARRYVTVSLSGDGADELFGGYGSHRRALLAHHAGRPRRTDALKYVAYRALRKMRMGGRDWMADRVQELAASQSLDKFGSVWMGHLASQAGATTYRAALGFLDFGDSHQVLADAFPPLGGASDMDQVFDFDLKVYLPGDILTKVDRASMAVSLESRAPFLDVNLAEFVLSIDWDIRFTLEQSKPLMRAALADLWPPSLRTRGKQGFGAPLDSWMRSEELKGVMQRVFSPHHPLAHLFPKISDARTRCRSQDQWTLLMLGLWLERHADALI